MMGLAVSEEGEGKGVNLSVVIPWLLSLATIAIGIWQFGAQQEQAGRLPFLQKQLDLCFQVTETAGRLASEADPAKWEEARGTFWRLYWGSLTMVEDPAVEAAMVVLGQSVPREPVVSPILPMRTLEQPAYRLAHAARRLVLASWRVDLPSLERRAQVLSPGDKLRD